MDEITENKLVGAKKRKSFAVKLNKLRAATLTDSGYKESSETDTSIEKSNNSSVDKSIAPREPSSRVFILKKIRIEKNSTPKVDEKILKNYLIRKNLVQARKDIAKTMMKWKPRIELIRLNPHEIRILSNNWRFLERLTIKDTIEFHAEILMQHSTLNSDQKRYFVRWWPTGIMEDSWIDESELPRDGIIKIDVQKMSWKQKLLVCDVLVNLSRSDKKKQKVTKKQS